MGVAPDAEIEGKGIVMISLVDGSVITCDDFLQNYNLKVYLWHAEKFDDGSDFLVTGDKEQLKPKEDVPEPEKMDVEKEKPANGASNNDAINVDDDIVEVVSAANGDKKRPAEEDSQNGTSKKARVEDDGDDVVFCEEKSPEELKKAAQKSAAAVADSEDGVVCLE